MIRTLAIKELRETIWMPALALVAFFLVESPYGRSGVGFVSSIKEHDAMIWPVLAIAIGFRQSVWESWCETWAYIFSRPVRRRSVIAVKLTTGLALVLMASGAPILILGWRAATPGNYASPFEWSMTVDSWMWCIAAGLIYLASFLSGVRPGSWFGTRLWPLASVGGLLWCAVLMPWRPMFVVTVAIAFAAGLVFSVLHIVRTRDY